MKYYNEEEIFVRILLILGEVHRKLLSLSKVFWCPAVSATARGAGIMCLCKVKRSWSMELCAQELGGQLCLI